MTDDGRGPAVASLGYQAGRLSAQHDAQQWIEMWQRKLDATAPGEHGRLARVILDDLAKQLGPKP